MAMGVSRNCEVLVVGGGPAGIAAACCAGESGAQVLLIDDNPRPGGQIWRGPKTNHKDAAAKSWFERLQKSQIDFIAGASVVSHPQPDCLIAETSEGACELYFRKLILATGARERFLPFPGWTLPNVLGPGGLQALVKGGLPINGKRVVVAGSGPLLLAVAAYLRECGAKIPLIAEQAGPTRLLRFGSGLLRQPTRVVQGFKLNRELRGISYHLGCWVLAADGDNQLESVRLRHGRKIWIVDCDYLACGYHLIPNLELALLLGCEIRKGVVHVDEFQQTSITDVYCAGEPTGIGGMDLSLIEGQIAGFSAAGRNDAAQKLFSARRQQKRFARLLNQTFSLRNELKQLADDETIVCRCEDVSFARLKAYNSWRAAKLQTRIGMGPCQGRVCGPATEFRFDWQVESVRPPIFPARVNSL